MRYHWAAAAATATGAALIVAATGLAAPAQASPVDTSFLSDLAGAGVPVGDPGATAALGQSVCPMLTEPAGTAASVAAPVASGLGGGPAMSPELAQMFAEIAVQAYCPQMLSQLASGQLPELPQIPGMPGAGGVPGLSVPIPGLAGGIPAIPAIPVA